MPRRSCVRSRTNRYRFGGQSQAGKGVSFQAQLFALCRPQFSDVAAVRRHASAYVVLDGCGRLRCAPDTQRCLPFRPRRGGHLQQRSTGQAIASARLSRCRRSLRRNGLLSAVDVGRSGAAGHAAGTQVVRRDSRRQRCRGGDRHHHELRQGTDAEGVPDSRHLGVSKRVAADHQGGGGLQRARAIHRLHRLRVDLEHRRQQPAPQRHLPRQRRASEPGRTVHHAGAAGQRQPGRAVEIHGGARSRRPAAKCSRSRTTAT